MKEKKRYKSSRSKEETENYKMNYDKRLYDGYDEFEDDELD